MLNYDGAELEVKDFNILKKLENIIGKELIFQKFFEDDYWDFTGFYAEDGKITHLSIQSEENLHKFPIEILKLTNLKMLVLIGLPIKAIPTQIRELKSLEILSIMFCSEMLNIPSSMGSLHSLIALNLFQNNLTTIPESIGKLESLEEFDLSHNQLKNLPTSIGKLKNLKTLLSSNNRLLSLPDSIGNLKYLKSLYLNDNMISSFPKTISNLKNLKWLEMQNNLISDIPDFLLDLGSLECLDLTNNKISKITNTMKKLEERGIRLSF